MLLSITQMFYLLIILLAPFDISTYHNFSMLLTTIITTTTTIKTFFHHSTFKQLFTHVKVQLNTLNFQEYIHSQ